MNIQQYSGHITPDILTLLLTADPNEAELLGYIKTARVLVAMDLARVVGVAVITGCNQQQELRNIAVESDWQGQGIAKALIAEVKVMAKESGADSLVVGTGNSSLSQMALYQKCGFRFFKIIPGFFAGYPEPIVENGIQCIDKVLLKFEF
ncbi:MAG: GNAT family N-acetyltransferase [Gammaproteobacteria bacterium]|nr:MAG: GNAT family N-acetyltransferase [Gammaproteobacteria bacterium]PCJ19705.1 MAG: GNAT family N-acetyltransferase [Gammaproteobacteria bacterium]